MEEDVALQLRKQRINSILSKEENNFDNASPWNKKVVPLLKARQAKDETIIREYEEIVNELEELDKEYNSLGYGYNMLTTQKRRDNIFTKIWNKITGKDRAIASKVNEEIMAKKEKLKIEIDEKKALLSDMKEKKEHAIKDLEELRDPENYSKQNVQKLIDENPELKKDPEFMTALVVAYPQAIALDESNSERVYNNFFSRYIKELKKAEQNTLYGDGYVDENKLRNIKTSIDIIEKVVEEINVPKVPEKGKYKIPHEYLFQTIKSLITGKINGVDVFDGQIHTIEQRLLNCSYGVGSLEDYLELDCAIPEQYGKNMESLMNNEEYYILRHKMYNSDIDQDSINDIMKNGIHDSSQGGRVQRLSNTFTGNFRATQMSPLTLVGLLDYSSTQMVYAFPREVLDNEQSLIWKNNDGDEVKYLDPKYLIGYVKAKEPKFEPNPIPISERTQYTNGYNEKGERVDYSEMNKEFKYTDVEDMTR